MPIPCKCLKELAGTTGLEPAASAVTGQRSNQLNYVPTRQINKMRNKQCLCGFARIAYIAQSAPDDQIASNPAETANKNLSKSSSQNYRNSFSRNAKGPVAQPRHDHWGTSCRASPPLKQPFRVLLILLVAPQPHQWSPRSPALHTTGPAVAGRLELGGELACCAALHGGNGETHWVLQGIRHIVRSR